MLAIFKGVSALGLCLLCSASSSACSTEEGLLEDASRTAACASAAHASAGSLIQVSSKPRPAEEHAHRRIAPHSALGQILKSAASKPKKSSGGDAKKAAKDLEPASSAPKKPSSGKTADGYPWEPLMDQDYVRDTSNPLDNSKYKVSSLDTAQGKPKSVSKKEDVDGKDVDVTVKEEKITVNDTSAAGGPLGVEESGMPETELYPPCPENPCPRTMNDAPGGSTPGGISLPIVSVPGCVVQGIVARGSLAGLGINIAKPGTPCLFGLDFRDGGAHCVLEEDKYGTYGWCYTKKDKSEWGSCASTCPAHGYDAVIAKREEAIDQLIMESIEQIDAKTHPCEK
mmetsp:Transcript_5706/g.10154  ORF Transcript_5706/g.10154 Transcript_5706/m.10154 type:complete len:341 (-) Transcript_5706:137-1159(-)